MVDTSEIPGRTGDPPATPVVVATDVVGTAWSVSADLAQRAERHDREGSYAPENIAAIWAAGLGNLAVPADQGGIGADLGTAGEVVEALATGDASTALIYVMHQSFLRELTSGDGAWPEPLRRRLIDDSLGGPALINALRVEPDLGTPARGGVPATTAVRADIAGGRTGWRLRGHKIYSTGSQGLRWMAVWATTAVDDPDGRRVGFFLVPAASEGVEIVETWDHLGMRASSSHDVILHDVDIPLDHAVNLRPAEAGGPPTAVQLLRLAWTNTLLLRIYLGVAKAGRDWLAGYLNERTPSNLGAPLASLPRFQAAMGDIEALIWSADQLISGVTTGLDAGGPQAAEAARRAPLVKVVVTGNVIRAMEQALALIGNPGLSLHHPLQRRYRDVLCSRIHTPQDDVVLTAVGRGVLGYPKPEERAHAGPAETERTDRAARAPSTLKRSPVKAQRTFSETLSSAEETYDGDERRAHQVAYGSLKHSFEKVGDHWEPKAGSGPSDDQSAQSGSAARDRPLRSAEGVDARASKAHLIDVARRLGIRGRTRMTKDDLVEAIIAANRRETAAARRHSG